MLGSQAVQSVFNYIRDNVGGISIYKYEKSKTETGEYIAINHLPFIVNDEVSTGEVNVNIHVPQTKSELPNIRRLEELTNEVVLLFKETVYLDGAYFDFHADSRPTPDSDKTYYINIIIKVVHKF